MVKFNTISQAYRSTSKTLATPKYLKTNSVNTYNQNYLYKVNNSNRGFLSGIKKFIKSLYFANKDFFKK